MFAAVAGTTMAAPGAAVCRRETPPVPGERRETTMDRPTKDRRTKDRRTKDRQTIVGEASTTVRASAGEVFDFVLDLHRYRQADHKIGRVGPVRRRGDAGDATFSGRLRGLPGPSGTYPFTLTADRLVFGTPTAGPARWFLHHFEGSFACEHASGGTRVTHREEFGFRRPWAWLAAPLLGRWLEADTAEEMTRLTAMLEADAHAPAGAGAGTGAAAPEIPGAG
jgi:hypothetical protein